VTETSFFEVVEITQRVGIVYSIDQYVAQAATHKTQNKTQEKNILNIIGIRTCDFRNQVVATFSFDCMTTGIGRDIVI